jgi:ribonuclease HII
LDEAIPLENLVAGVDEAGRGPLAGPVVVAAVILGPGKRIKGLGDSKKLSEQRRDRLFPLIVEQALAYSIVEVQAEEIDQLNILQATLLGMKMAVERLEPYPSLALIDGNRAPALGCEVKTIIKGDSLEPAISAASILAKVTRDRLMQTMHRHYPDYGFDRHKGYPTAEHLARLSEHGPCIHHRKSFAPVRNAMQKNLL